MTKPNGTPINVKQPGSWTDDLPEPLHTEADVDELFEKLAKRKAELALEEQNKKQK